MVSLKDIASMCGVSAATVSKALNDHNDIGEETKARIRETAARLGYVPNSAAKALKTDHTHSIGVLFVDNANSGLTHDFFAGVLDSFKREVEGRGYDITFISTNKSIPGRSSYLEHARFRRFDGVVIACVDFEDPEVIELVSSDIPVVTIDYVFNNRLVVCSDNVKGMQDILEYVAEMGHTRVAYIHGADSSVTRNRLVSFYRSAEERNIEIPDEYVREADYRDSKATYEETKALLELPVPPTCILFPDDFSAFGGIRAIEEKGLRIPEDISIVGYDGIAAAKNLTPTMTTIKQDTAQMGRLAGEQLVNLIESPKTTLVGQLVVSGELRKGGTVKNLKA